MKIPVKEISGPDNHYGQTTMLISLGYSKKKRMEEEDIYDALIELDPKVKKVIITGTEFMQKETTVLISLLELNDYDVQFIRE